MDRPLTVFWTALFVIVVLYALATFSPVRAQESDPVLILAKTLAGEAGFKQRPDHAAMLHVLEWRRKHRPANIGATLPEVASVFSTLHWARLKNPQSDHWRQVADLTIDTSPEWMVDMIETFLIDPEAVPDPCRGRARDWAAFRVVMERGKLHRVVRCGRTKNVFLR